MESAKQRRRKRYIIKNLQKKYEKLVTKSYSEEAMIKYFFDYIYNPYAAHIPIIQQVNQISEIECIRKKSDNSLYSVYKTDEGGLFYCYFFYDNGYWYLDHAAYMKKALLIKDFESIDIGDSVTDAENIDPIVTVCKYYGAMSSDSEFVSFHLLKDGLLLLTYTKDSSGNYIVSDKQYSKDFIWDFNPMLGVDRTMDYSIFEDDYIK